MSFTFQNRWWRAAVFAVSFCAADLPTGPLRAKQPQGAPLKILFVGNSFSHGKYAPVRNYNSPPVIDENTGLPPGDPRSLHSPAEFGPYGGIPGIFKKMTDQAGLPYEVHDELVSATHLAFHYRYALPVIAQAQWDAVVLQDYSTGPLPAARGGTPESFLTYATLLEQAVHTVNPKAKLYLYETWPRADMVYPPGKPYSGQSIELMGLDLHHGYQQAFVKDGHFAAVAWVGDAWLRSMQTGLASADPYQPVDKSGPVDLWGVDHYHPSVWGAYLAALTLFQTITGVSPKTLGANEQAAHDLKISSDDALKLQAIAGQPPSTGDSVHDHSPAVSEPPDSSR